MVALAVGILPNLPGFLIAVKKWPASWPQPALLVNLYQYAWFVGFVLAFVFYILLRKISGFSNKPAEN
jgi:NCS1 family nucleobase:cation symporter-1